jgi:hypothetical protein
MTRCCSVRSTIDIALVLTRCTYRDKHRDKHRRLPSLTRTDTCERHVIELLAVRFADPVLAGLVVVAVVRALILALLELEDPDQGVGSLGRYRMIVDQDAKQQPWLCLHR